MINVHGWRCRRPQPVAQGLGAVLFPRADNLADRVPEGTKGTGIARNKRMVNGDHAWP